MSLRFVLMPQVRQHVDNPALVDLRDIACNGEVEKEQESEDCLARCSERVEEGGKGASSKNVQKGQHGIEEADFLVGDEAQGEGNENTSPSETA